MRLDEYPLDASEDPFTYEFTSDGSKGSIRKVIQFSRMGGSEIYNLGFGDLNSETGDLDDLIVTDNGDSEKVLATVVSAVYSFLNNFPYVWIYITGSTPARTRLYRMGINKYFEIAENDFFLQGETQTNWEPYVKGKDYLAFAIRRKKVNLGYEKGYRQF